MPNLHCGHDNVTKVLRFKSRSVEDSGKAIGNSIGVISLCDECWTEFLLVVEAAKANPLEKYVDSAKVNRVFVVPEA